MLEIVDCEQNSPEWYEARLGIPTASNCAAILAKGRGGGVSKTRRTYLYKLAGERLTGEPAENYTNDAMARGHALEDEARRLYAFSSDVEVEQIGFAKNHGAGASPDGLVGADGVVEIKSCAAHVLISHIEAGRPPPEHLPQVQAQMWVLERRWCDLFLYCPGIAPFQVRIPRDDAYITDTLAPAVRAFQDELEALVARLTARAG